MNVHWVDDNGVKVGKFAAIAKVFVVCLDYFQLIVSFTLVCQAEMLTSVEFVVDTPWQRMAISNCRIVQLFFSCTLASSSHLSSRQQQLMTNMLIQNWQSMLVQQVLCVVL